jgi:hypothetical protein
MTREMVSIPVQVRGSEIQAAHLRGGRGNGWQQEQGAFGEY